MKFGCTFVQAFLRSTERKLTFVARLQIQFIMRLMSWHIDNDYWSRLSVFTADDVLKRCISGHPVYSVSMAFTSKDSISREELQALAQHLFSLLQVHDGFLVFLFPGVWNIPKTTGRLTKSSVQ